MLTDSDDEVPEFEHMNIPPAPSQLSQEPDMIQSHSQPDRDIREGLHMMRYILKSR